MMIGADDFEVRAGSFDFEVDFDLISAMFEIDFE
jgi:hypothetical protein